MSQVLQILVFFGMCVKEFHQNLINHCLDVYLQSFSIFILNEKTPLFYFERDLNDCF